MSLSESKKNSAPSEAVAGLTATVNRLKVSENRRRLIERVMLAKAATLSDTQLLTLMYAGKEAPKKQATALVPT
jgi:hypothetical protein